MHPTQRTLQGLAAAGTALLGVIVGAASAPVEQAAAASVPPRPARASKAPSSPAGPEQVEAGCGEDSHVPALRDAAERRAALGRFRRSLDRAELEELAVALGAGEDPEVVATALELAAADPQPVRRLAAFDLLDHLDPPGAVEVVLATLGRERDPELRRAALFALPPPADRTGVARVGRTLGGILRADRDPETRRRAALALGSWTSRAGVAVLAASLRGDPDPRVRAGCAFALETAGPLPPGAIAALRAALEDPREDRLVRDNARHALEGQKGTR